ncbi:hypothetical protein F5Y19DRAFT_358930 [Xylariaceae sp. FL1651]|nr:hypothetical protein F5Y19DRAFT_358930 [Xylariaceae sp. FL1651]
MAIQVTVYTAPPEALAKRLQSYLPHSLLLIRRMRFTRFPGGITEHARVLWASTVSLEDHLARYPDVGAGKLEREGGGERETEAPFAAAYLDFSRGPETELWLFSSTERRGGAGVEDGIGGGDEIDSEKKKKKKMMMMMMMKEEEEEEGIEQDETACLVTLLREVRRLQDAYFVPGSTQAAEREFPTVLLGNLNEVVRERLAAPGVGMAIWSTGLYDKWIFRVDDLPDVVLPEELRGVARWDIVRPEHIAFTISRTHILRRERTMKLLPSTALYVDDGNPIAWAFLGPDSSLSSLHCEEPYRGKGLAKAVAVKILKDHLKDYGDEGYGWADVAPDNTQSRGVCRSLRGKITWQISWSRLDLYQSFPDQ